MTPTSTAHKNDALLKAGDNLCDRYRVVTKIADGGMASVYLAIDESTNSEVAIKVLFPHYWNNATVRTRFLDEGRIQAMLRHSNIVRVYRVLHKPILAFVMEYIDGVCAEEHLNEQERLSEYSILEIILPVMSAIGFAHSKGIIHRDIKPSNILLKRAEGGRLQPKVMDFGVAKMTSGRDLTAAGTTVGTLHYMSPEQIVGSRNIDGRADIYSLGVTLYKLCTGEVPFNASTEFALMMAQVEAPPLPPRQLRADLSKEMEAIILKALEKKPQNRFQSIKAFTTALLRLLPESDGGPDTDTAPLPPDLLKHAMSADEVAQDRTGEFNLSAFDYADTEEDYARLTDTNVDTVEMTSPLQILDDRPGFRKAGKPSGMDKVKKDVGDTQTIELSNPSFLEEDALPVATPALGTGGQKEYSKHKERVSTLENTTPWKDGGRRKGKGASEKGRDGGIVAVDLGADSKEITALEISEQEFNDAVRQSYVQAQTESLMAQAVSADLPHSESKEMATEQALELLAEVNLFHCPSKEREKPVPRKPDSGTKPDHQVYQPQVKAPEDSPDAHPERSIDATYKSNKLLLVFWIVLAVIVVSSLGLFLVLR